ncbi:MAG: hypothetical protein EOP47_16115, partial [Sphingobacteriaceae bacterium]
MRVAFISTSFILSSFCIAQPQLSQQIDSLQKIYNKSKADSNYIDILILKANTVLYTDYDLAEKFADSAIALAFKNQLPKKKAASCRLKGVILTNKGELVKALEYTYQALKEAAPINNKLFNAGIYNNIGTIHLRIGKYDSAIYYFKRLFHTAKEENALHEQAIACANLTGIYLNTDSLQQNKEYAKIGLGISIPQKMDNISSYILFNLASGYLKRNNSDSAMTLMQQSLQYANNAKLMDASAQAMLGLSNIYLAKKQYTLAITTGEQALEQAKSFNALNFQEQVLPLLSDAYDSIGNKGKALLYY